MFITMITPECAPAAKVGGLGDVVQGLSRELGIRGNDVEIILPKYDCMRYDRIWDLQKSFSDLWVPFQNQDIHCDVYFGFVDGLKCFFIEPHSTHNFFNRGIYYGHKDDPDRFAFFSKAALEFMLKSNKHPDIIHCHDWQTGLVPVLLYEIYQHIGMSHPRVCYTLHNLKHQGVTGAHTLSNVGLDPGRLVNQNRLQDNFNHNGVNIMKGGIVYSNFITTVSPQYAHEIKFTGQGFGLQHTLNVHHRKFGGVLNGVDYNVWNPEIDQQIPFKYNIDTIKDKYKNKEALRHRLLLRQDYKPIISVVSRLDHQKGVGLILHSIHYALANGCQFVLLGSSPDSAINNDFLALKHHLNDNPDCHLEISYNEELAHLIYAGADMLVIPSAFEPCGLTQMIAMKYGTVPIVRNVGGLSNTVFDADYARRPYHERNGYVFNEFDSTGLDSALHRAIGLWYNYPQYFRELMINGMKHDYSWDHPGADYLNIYNFIRA
ncbi:MAG: glycogen synthase [Desulfobulbaceae bacterium]|nr:glycogen synthase [Desulfobulbaceae bacterium]